MHKRLFSLILLIIIIGFCAYPPPKLLASLSETTFSLSNIPEENTSVVLQGRNLFILNWPNSQNFNYILLKLIDDQDKVSFKKCKKAKKSTYSAQFNLRGVPNGSYSVEIYYAPKRFTSYVSYIHGQALRIEINNSAVKFIHPPSFAKNQEVFASNMHDRGTLNLYSKPSSKVESDDPAIIQLAQTITSGLSSNYDKAQAVHDWVSNNIWYNYDELYSGISSDASALDTLSSKTGVCTGYASLTAALLRAVDVPAKLVTGHVLDSSIHESWTPDLIASNQGNHVWNEAYIDGRWIIIDTSYDSNNAFINKKFSADTGMKSRKYFDITIDLLSADRYIIPREFDPLRLR